MAAPIIVTKVLEARIRNVTTGQEFRVFPREDRDLVAVLEEHQGYFPGERIYTEGDVLELFMRKETTTITEAPIRRV